MRVPAEHASRLTTQTAVVDRSRLTASWTRDLDLRAGDDDGDGEPLLIPFSINPPLEGRLVTPLSTSRRPNLVERGLQCPGPEL